MKQISFGLCCWMLASSVFSTQLQQQTNQLINQADPSINMGALIVDLTTGETLYERNSSHALIPASNMKLFSDAAALLALGPDYRFKTQLSTDAPRLAQGDLEGSIYLTLPGDPSLTTAHLDSLLSKLQQLGIQRIRGDVILISEHARTEPYAPGWMQQDLAYSYGAPLSPVILDENRLLVTVNPSAMNNNPALIELSNTDGSILVNNQVKTTQQAAHCGLSYIMDNNNQLTVRGCIGVGQWAALQRIAIRNPLQYAASQIKARLARRHITLLGDVKLGSSPKQALLIATHQSKPISQLMADTLKPSDNLYADSLYLHAASVLHGSPVNWAEAQPVIKTFLEQQTGISLSQAVLTDGSGLSRHDRLSAQQTVALLKFLYTRFPLTYEYIAALPVSGRDGTLQKRLKNFNQQGLVRAKTGSLTGVSSLSGYLYTANAHTLAFALFINKNPKTPQKVSGRYLIDKLCDFFLRQKPDDKRVTSIPDAHARVSFQQYPTEAEALRNQQSRWRRIEYAVKQALKGQPVTILFRHDQLILNDQSNTANNVWLTLQTIRKKYPFAVALRSPTAPSSHNSAPMLLWINDNPAGAKIGRTWTLQESI